jgi:hypothetical protein
VGVGCGRMRVHQALSQSPGNLLARVIEARKHVLLVVMSIYGLGELSRFGNHLCHFNLAGGQGVSHFGVHFRGALMELSLTPTMFVRLL